MAKVSLAAVKRLLDFFTGNSQASRFRTVAASADAPVSKPLTNYHQIIGANETEPDRSGDPEPAQTQNENVGMRLNQPTAPVVHSIRDIGVPVPITVV